MMLEIIMPHYKEPWNVVKPFFDMLCCQHCVNFSEFSVHIVHDGTPGFNRKYFEDMPFQVTQTTIRHGGVSAARNYGLDHAKAKWICFCDCDDTFVSVYALHEIMNVLGSDQYDMLWSRMVVEDYIGEEKHLYFSPDRARFVFTHAKVYRTAFLHESGIRFDESLTFNEDSCFNATIISRTPYKRIGEIRSTFPIYAWIRRANSVTNSGRDDEANYGHFRRNLIVTEENRKNRGEEFFQGMVTRTAYDAYYMLHSRGISDGIKAKIRSEFVPWITERYEAFGKVDADALDKIREIARIELYDMNENIPDDHESIAAWVDAVAHNNQAEAG